MKNDPLETPDNIIEQSKTPSQDDYLEIKIPRISFRDTKINTYLVTALVIFAFFLGMLTNKVISLETALKTAGKNNTAQANQANDVQGITNNAPPQDPTPPPVVDVAIGHLPTLGAENPKVTVIEFSDFQCPFCKRFVDNTYQELYDAYIKTNKIKFAYRHYPLNSIHPNAQKAAEASECASVQNKFWEYHDLLFKNQENWSPQSVSDAANSFADYAANLGLNTDQFRSCLDTDKYKEKVQEDIADAAKAAIDGTPTFFINGRRLVGAAPFAQIQELIEKELKK